MRAVATGRGPIVVLAFVAAMSCGGAGRAASPSGSPFAGAVLVGQPSATRQPPTPDTDEDEATAHRTTDPVADLGHAPTADLLPTLRRRARAGEACADAALGYLRALGIGMPVEPRDGRADVEAAADRGCARAHYLLARLDEKVPAALRQQREGLAPSDVAERVRAELEKGAARNDGHALNHLGTLREIDHDPAGAATRYRQARALGNRAALQNLRRLERLSAVKTASEPLADLERRARAGDAEAQYRLARRLHRGQGAPIDYAGAWRWYQESAHRRFKPAEDMMTMVLAQPRIPGEPVTATWLARLAPFDVPSDPVMRQRGLRQPVIDEDPFYDMRQ